MASGEFDALLAHVDPELLDKRFAQFLASRPALLGTLAVDRPLDVEQGIDTVHDLDRDRRERNRFLARSPPPGVLLNIGHGEERTPGVSPAPHLRDRTGTSFGQIERAIPVKGVGLEQPGISGQMALRMLAFAIAGVIEHRRRRALAPEWPIVAHINPTSPRIGLAFGQDRHGRIVAMQAFGRHDMRLDESQHRFEHRAARPYGIGHRREADRYPLQGIAPGLPVQGLMLAELLEQDHRQQAGPGPAPGDHVEGCGGLADLLAIPAGELLPYRFDHLPLARDYLQGLRHVLAQLAQPGSAAALNLNPAVG